MDVEIEFPIIADAKGEIAERIEMVHPNKESQTVRAVFIIDTKAINA